ncbi:MRP4 protein, partial [Acromyrmex charruanus]
VQVVKMYAWEKPVTYEMSTYFNILQLVVALYFPQGLILLGESIVSFNRLEDFLLMDEMNTRRFSENTPQLQFKSQKSKEESNAENQIDRYISRNGSIFLSEHQRLSDLPVYVKFQRVSANWIQASGQLSPTLCNINLTIKPGQLCAVIGAVGFGKSSILHLLLKELNPDTGSIILTQGSSKYNFPGNLSTEYFTNNPNLRISYASQEPWLFGSTVRDIYCWTYSSTVANVCALTKDFRQFPQGDMTMVGDRGVSLSGGQRARINLARAVYRQADIYLFDDPLRVVNTHVAKHLYGKCITEYLHGKTRIFVTHQFLKRADYIVVLDRGFVKMQGNYNELVQSNKDFIGMLDNLNQAQRKEEDMRRASEMSKRITITRRILRLSTTSSITHSDIDDSDYVENIPEAEMMNSSSNRHNIFFKLLQVCMSFFRNNPSTAMNQTGTGQIMNLLSNDVIRFDQLTMYLNYIWIMPFTIILHFTAIIGTIMWQKVSISSFVSTGTLLIIVLLGQGTLNFLNLKLRTMIAPLTDRRVQLMSELIAGYPQEIVMKMYAWKKPFSQIVSVIRLQDFLLMDEVNTRRFSENTPQLQFKSQKPKEESNVENQIDRYISRNGSIVLSEHRRLSDLPVYVKLQRVSANWISGQLPPTLCNINLTIKPSQLCAAVGAVGSGKSILSTEGNPGTSSIILTQDSSKYNFPGNLSTGYFTNNPNLRISYASQEPWLFGGTVRVYCLASSTTRLDTCR